MSLIQNNNQAVIRRLAWRSLKMNRFRTICTLITIFICTFVMAIVPLINTASIETFYIDFRDEAHGSYIIDTAAQEDSVRNDTRLDTVLTYAEGAPASIDDTHYVQPVYISGNSQTLIFYTLTDGVMPETSSEAAVDAEFAQTAGITVGSQIHLSTVDGFSRSFTVTGLARTQQDKNIPLVYVSASSRETGGILEGVPTELLVRLTPEAADNFDDTSDILNQIAGNAHIPADRVSINYMSFENQSMTPTHILLYIFIDLCCLAVGILVIYSIFNISVTARISEFGQMQTIGMTSRQIRRFVSWEALIETAVGTVLGIFFAAVISWAVTGYWSWRYLGITSVLVFVCSLGFIMFFLRKPAKKAAGISPLSAYTLTEYADNSVGRHKLTPAGLAKGHFKRERKKSLFTMLSMTIAGTLFLLSASWLCAVDNDAMARQSYFTNTEYRISYIGDSDFFTAGQLIDLQKQNILSEKLINDLYTLPEIAHIDIVRSEIVSFWDGSDYVSDFLCAFTETDYEQFAPYLPQDAPSWQELVDSGSVLFVDSGFGISFDAGESVRLTYTNAQGEQHDTVPLAVTLPIEVYDHYPEYGSFIIPEPVMETMYPGVNTTSHLLVTTKDHQVSKDLDDRVKEITSRYPLIELATFTDYSANIQSQNRLLYGILLAVSAIGMIFSLINLINTTVSTMVSRNRELALLEAVGMHAGMIRKMLVFECLYMSVPSLIISLCIGIFGGCGIINLMISGGVSFLTYRFPAAYVLCYTSYAIVFPIAAALICFRRFSKKGIMERLKELN